MNEQQAKQLPTWAGELGALWSAEQTVFRLWAPTAEKVEVGLFSAGSPREGSSHPEIHPLHQREGGVWETTLPGDLHGVYYTFGLTVNGKFAEIVDPYARAAGVNGKRGMVLDDARAVPEGWAQDARPTIVPGTQSVWEVHVADFSADPRSGVRPEWQGKYLGFTEQNTTLDGAGEHPTCLNYLKQLGVTHVQLQPIYDFGRIDESHRNAYNWGYDPLNYNLPEGSYATDPYHGEVRVRECRAMIQALHKAGLAVVMDVVYNHTYHSDNWLEQSVPGYYNRRTPNGKLTNGSGCGNDLASERTMYRKYMVDSVRMWAKEYHIDGFRFDLMALHDVETMNAIRAALDELPRGKEILMYGEPWMGGSTNLDSGARPADKGALEVLSERIGVFCDNTRDAIKGSVFNGEEPGYVNGASWRSADVKHSVNAWLGGEGGFHPKSAGQVVQYVSAHDNFTLWDKLCLTGHRQGKWDEPDPVLLAQNAMCAGIYLTCRGLPFLQAGEEFARTKLGDPNTWCGPRNVNALDWARTVKFDELVQYYRGLFALRKAYPELSGLQNAGAKTAPQAAALLELPGNLIGFTAEDKLAVFYNPEADAQAAVLPAGSWQLLSDGHRAGAEPFGAVQQGETQLAARSVTILKRV